MKTSGIIDGLPTIDVLDAKTAGVRGEERIPFYWIWPFDKIGSQHLTTTIR
jgi:hypothetical protein